jgi:glycosyltransferase involved in cell wall biosynthesis
MNVLFLTQNDARGASSRLRVYQFLEPLARLGIRSEVWPLPFGMATSRWRVARGALHALHAATRWIDVRRAARFDAVVIQRDLVAHLRPFLEETLAERNPRIVLDVDDPIHLHPPSRPPALPFRWFGDPRKLERLARSARRVVAANRALRDEAARAGARVTLIPTSLDTARWAPGPVRRAPGTGFTVGWIGSPGTTFYLEGIAPALAALARALPVRLRAVGADPALPARFAALAPGVAVEAVPWTLAREVEEVRGFDAGVMPLTDDPWSRAKSATKLLQYMACGVPAVASPVGANADIVKDGVNGFLAEDAGGWTRALRALAEDARLAARLGEEGRATVAAEYSVEVSAPKLAAVLREVGEGRC